LTIALSQAPIEGDEVVITDNKARKNVEQATMGVIDIPIEQVEMLPFLSGEKDLLKVIQLLPGVQAGGEGSSGFYVRGGQADQNLILMDEAIVYNPFHLAGYLSVFNSDAIRNITLHKGSFPAQYGGRLLPFWTFR
jgi:outer membrane receptor protein involved in Fe transport